MPRSLDLRLPPNIPDLAGIVQATNREFEKIEIYLKQQALGGTIGSSLSADLDAANFRILNVADAQKYSDAINFGQASRLFATKAQIAGLSGGTSTTIINQTTGAIAGTATPVPRTAGYVTADPRFVTSAINAAIASLPPEGGFVELLPGLWIFDEIINLAGRKNVVIFGYGPQTILQRPTSFHAADGKGLIDLSGATSNIKFASMVLDANQTTPQNVNNPTDTQILDPILSKDTTVWIHNGVSRVVFEDVDFTHTRGYSVLVDATAGRVDTVTASFCRFLNCYAHLAGTTGDYNYGTWTSGIHYEGSASSNGYCSNLSVEYCVFDRVAGHAIWGHSNDLSGTFNVMHRNVRIVNNTFKDIGLDSIQIGNTDGATVVGNVGRRAAGYVVVDDTSASTPRWNPFASRYGVFIDTTGSRAMVVVGNSCVSANGGFADLDGAHNFICCNNSFYMFDSSESGYTDDNYSSLGPGAVGNRTKGIQFATSYFNGRAGGMVSGNYVRNCGTNAVVLAGAQMVQVVGNTIIHPSSAAGVPIYILNTGSPSTEHSYDNVVANNLIEYSGANWAIYEDPGGFAWNPAERNYVRDNDIVGTSYGAFHRDTSSGSQTAAPLWSNSDDSGLRRTQFIQQTEGFSTSAALKTYFSDNLSGGQMMVLIPFGSGSLLNPALNVSYNGGAYTGSVNTGNRLTVGVPDSMNTGVMTADGHLALSRATYTDARADAFPGTWVLLRVKNVSTPVLEVSYTAVSGSRVWQDLISGVSSATTPGGGNTEIQFNDSGVFGAKSTFTFTKASDLLTVPNIQHFKIPRWGDANAGGYLLFEGATGYNDWKVGTFQNVFRISHGYAVDMTVLLTGESTGAVNLFVQGKAGTASIVAQAGYMQAAEGYYSPASGIVAFNAPASAVGIKSVNWTPTATASSPTAAAGVAYFDSTLGQFRGYNGSAWVNFGGGTGGGTPAGPTQAVQWNNGGSFGGSSGITYDDSLQKLFVGSGAAPSFGSSFTPNLVVINNGTRAYGTAIYVATNGSANDPPRIAFERYTIGTTWSIGMGKNSSLLGGDGDWGIFRNGGYGGYGAATMIITSATIDTAYNDFRLNYWNQSGDRQTAISFYSSGAAGSGSVSATLVRLAGVNGALQLQNYGSGYIDIIGVTATRFFLNGVERANLQISGSQALLDLNGFLRLDPVDANVYNALTITNGGGVLAATIQAGTAMSMTSFGTVINSSGQWVGAEVNIPSRKVITAGVDPYVGGQYYGLTLAGNTFVEVPTYSALSGGAFLGYVRFRIKGGACVDNV